MHGNHLNAHVCQTSSLILHIQSGCGNSRRFAITGGDEVICNFAWLRTNYMLFGSLSFDKEQQININEIRILLKFARDMINVKVYCCAETFDHYLFPCASRCFKQKETINRVFCAAKEATFSYIPNKGLFLIEVRDNRSCQLFERFKKVKRYTGQSLNELFMLWVLELLTRQ